MSAISQSTAGENKLLKSLTREKTASLGSVFTPSTGRPVEVLIPFRPLLRKITSRKKEKKILKFIDTSTLKSDLKPSLEEECSEPSHMYFFFKY